MKNTTLRNKKIILSISVGALILAILISLYGINFVLNQTKKDNEYVNNDFNSGLERITLTSSGYKTLLDVKNLIGENIEEYEYTEKLEDLNKFRPSESEFYRLDQCVIVAVKDSIIKQAGTGSSLTQDCFENPALNKLDRIEMFGEEDIRETHKGFAGMLSFIYLDEGVGFVKLSSNLKYVWFTNQLDLDSYKSDFGGFFENKTNDMLFVFTIQHPVPVEDGHDVVED